MTFSNRWTIVEYSDTGDILQSIAASTGLNRADIRQLIEMTGERIRSTLRLTASPLYVDRDQLRAEDIAGIVRVSPQIELEIAPKFLGVANGETGWREDLFYLSTLSRYGRVLPSERLRSGRSASRDLPTLVARSMIDMYERNRQRPLRTYRRTTEFDFALDGDVDVETLVLPSPDGFEQEVVRYDRRNVYNATIRAAALRLAQEVRNPGIKAQLQRISADLSPQRVGRSARMRLVPSRSRSWQSLYDLSADVLQGFGMTFDAVFGVRSPGFLVSTWQIWEDFVSVALRLGFADDRVHGHKTSDLGRRIRFEREGAVSEGRVTVTPDVTIEIATLREPLLLDAKYKTRVELLRQRISEADIYESLAFARASNTSQVILLYPAVGGTTRSPIGSAIPFESVSVDNVTITACMVETRGISAKGALGDFATRLRDDLMNLISKPPHVESKDTVSGS